MGRIVFGIVLTGLFLIQDAYTQVVDFCKGGYSDEDLSGKVWDAILTFTIGIFTVAGVVYLVVIIVKVIQQEG